MSAPPAKSGSSSASDRGCPTAITVHAWRAVEEGSPELNDDQAGNADAAGACLNPLLNAVFCGRSDDGCRFGACGDRGIWYGAERPQTMLHELAFYRFLMHTRSGADPGPRRQTYHVFRASIHTRRGLDLTRCDWARCRHDYTRTRAAGARARREGVQVLRYGSAREPAAGPCVAVLCPNAFDHPEPLDPPRAWICEGDGRHLVFHDPDGGRSLFRVDLFQENGRLPHPCG